MTTTTALTTFQDRQTMAQYIASSGLFGVSKPEQALSLMALCEAEGLHPATAIRDYHIINGRPTLKADAMLARFLASGGKVEWLTYTDQEVRARFSHPAGGSIELDWTPARAKQAGIQNAMHNKYPRQMLRSRVISEGVRTVCPQVAIGIYTPEEAEEMPPPKQDAPPADNSKPTDIKGDARELSNIDIENRKNMCEQFRDILAADLEEEARASMILTTWGLWTEDQDYFRDVLWNALEAKERSAIKAYVKMARDAQQKVLANGRAA